MSPPSRLEDVDRTRRESAKRSSSSIEYDTARPILCMAGPNPSTAHLLNVCAAMPRKPLLPFSVHSACLILVSDLLAVVCLVIPWGANKRCATRRRWTHWCLYLLVMLRINTEGRTRDIDHQGVAGNRIPAPRRRARAASGLRDHCSRCSRGNKTSCQRRTTRRLSGGAGVSLVYQSSSLLSKRDSPTEDTAATGHFSRRPHLCDRQRRRDPTMTTA